MSDRSARPRLYSLDPRHDTALRTGPESPGWRRTLQRASALGFDHILCAPCWHTAPDEHLGADDPAALEPALGGTDIDTFCQQLARAAHEQGLGLWLDLCLTRTRIGGPRQQQHPPWHEPPDHTAFDPRQPTADGSGAAVRSSAAQVPAGFVAFWQQRLLALHAVGVQGVRLLAPQLLPSAVWQALRAGLQAQAADLRLTAWTPGLNPAQVASLESAGFDAVYSSLAWWNLRAPWYAAEHERLMRAGCIIAPVADPDTAGAALPPNALLQRLRVAGELADGLLLPAWADPGSQAETSLQQAIRRANLALSRRPPGRVRQLHPLGGETLPITWLQRQDRAGATLVAINPSLTQPAPLNWALACARLASAVPPGALRQTELAPGGVLSVMLSAPSHVVTRRRKGHGPRERAALEAALCAPRIAIQDLSPATADPAHLIKRVIGEAVVVRANIFMDGHDVLAARVLWRALDEADWHAVPMRALGNDAWEASFVPSRLGRHEYTVQAWRDVFGSYRSELAQKHAAGLQVSLELCEGRALLARAGIRLANDIDAATLLGQAMADAMAQADLREFEQTHAPAQSLLVERRAARFASWYELFPRSQSGDAQRHGTLRDVIARLPYVRDMGFDVLYFTPIHPIGHTHRKGRNNRLRAEPGDPGSPYAIGSAEGGHDALHPELGTMDDFRALIRAAAEHDLEIALDFAIQCSPDHPWLREHPAWFSWRADGSLRHAENPPKKYEDIVNVDYYGLPGGRRRKPGNGALWRALRDVVLFWCDAGVRTFRVDNPHTKPLPFWQWLMAEVQARHPDVIFLAEAFTRPNMMYRLARIGFSQSYTYFTWRNTRDELAAYLQELASPPVADVFRPHFFVNTPDINPYFLQHSGRAGFLIRAALAGTLSGLWGMYSGFELCENTPVPGKEEYLDSEKYELRARDWEQAGHIRGEISQLNRIRRTNPALHTHRNVQFLRCDNEQVLYFCKATPERDNVLLIAISLDPHAAHSALLELPLWQFGIPDEGTLQVHDLVHEHRFATHGRHQHLALHPEAPYAIWRVHT